MDANWKKKFNAFAQSWVGSIVIAFLIALTFKSIIVDWNDVPSGSMKPTILEGDRIFVNKLAYDLKLPFWSFNYRTIPLIHWGDPKRGDIVVFYAHKDNTSFFKKRLVKRVVGLPGDLVKIQDNRLQINGTALTYQKINPSAYPDLGYEREGHHFYLETLGDKKHPVMIRDLYPGENTMGSDQWKIPADHYIMIGDNRTNSADSRYFGLVDRKQIVGRAVAIAISRESSFLHPRWHRFF